jgi:hypothetical protein
MLAVNSYPPEYIARCRTNIDQTVKAYAKVAAAAKGDAAAIAKFEPRFFEHLVLALDEYFVHRLRAVEGKDGNPLNEVRVLASSLMQHDGVLTVEKSIKLDPATSVLGLAAGEPITLDQASFTKLAHAFFDELEARFT